MKYCPKCNQYKEEFQFHKCRTYKDGLYYICKECAMIAKMRYKKSEEGKLADKRYQQSEKGRESQKRSRIKRNLNGVEYLREKRRRCTDESYRLSSFWMNRLYKALNQPPANPKTCRWYKEMIELLGCSVDELKVHLEQQFEPGMTWDNYGAKVNCWQIDHIVPRSYFDLTKEENLRICFNYRNCRPLWRTINCGVKNAKVPENVNELINNIKENLL